MESWDLYNAHLGGAGYSFGAPEAPASGRNTRLLIVKTPERKLPLRSGEPRRRGVTGSNFEMKPERRRMPGFGLHFEVRAGHAEPSVQVPQVCKKELQNFEKLPLESPFGAGKWGDRAGGFPTRSRVLRLLGAASDALEVAGSLPE